MLVVKNMTGCITLVHSIPKLQQKIWANVSFYFGGFYGKGHVLWNVIYLEIMSIDMCLNWRSAKLFTSRRR